MHVLHSATCLVENLEHRVARQGSVLFHPLYEVHQLTCNTEEEEEEENSQ